MGIRFRGTVICDICGNSSQADLTWLRNEVVIVSVQRPGWGKIHDVSGSTRTYCPDHYHSDSELLPVRPS